MDPFKVKATSWINHRNERFTQVVEYYPDVAVFYDVDESSG